MTLALPGGGGFYPPQQRDPGAVHQDVIDGLVSLTQARDVYGVVLDPVTTEIDMAETVKLRSTKKPES